MTEPYCRACSRYANEARHAAYGGPPRKGELFRVSVDRIDGRPRLLVPCTACGLMRFFSYHDFAKEIGFDAARSTPRDFMRALFAKYPNWVARHLYDWLRHRRYQARVEERTWEDYFTGDELAWLRERLSGLMRENGDSCIDNGRVAQKNKPRQVARYKNQRASGCCGSHDVEVSHDGKTYLMGFNYGH